MILKDILQYRGLPETGKHLLTVLTDVDCVILLLMSPISTPRRAFIDR